MAAELYVPHLGQTVEEVTVVQWLVPDGAEVSQGQPVVEVETDKAIFPLEANATGSIHFGPYKVGQVVPVLTVVATIGKPDEAFVAAGSLASPPAAADAALNEASAVVELASPVLPPAVPGMQKLFASPRARKLAERENVDLQQITPTGYAGVRVAERDVLAFLGQSRKITPVAQRMASESGVDVRSIAGTGPGGRIRKEDVARAMPPQSSGGAARPEVVERIPLRGVRSIIAERMAASVHTSARVTLMMEADATAFVEARTRLKQRVEQEWGFAPTYTDLFVKIVAAALRQFPYVNARLASDSIEILGHINVGVAVDTERGLLVPVVHDADLLNLKLLSTETRRLGEAARTGRISPDDLTGGSFTITNLGMYEVEAFTPVINLPEAAILGIGQIASKVIPYEGQPAIRQVCTLSLAFDHRLLDGAPAARFLQSIKHMVEEPLLLLTY